MTHFAWIADICRLCACLYAAEKRRLEERIMAMQSQLLVGGHTNNLADTPAFRTALQQV